jgi:uroporphyrinogen-III synthase
LAHKVFISKEASEVQELNNFLDSNGDRLIAHSFLHFEKVEFELESAFDVIFFGSPRAVIFFKAQNIIPTGVLIACAGAKTAELLEHIGHPADFVGVNSGKMKDVAAKFKEWCGDKHVLFPTSDLSLKTVSSVFDDSQKTEITVYSTQIKGKEIEASDTYVFTSPSNVKGFLESNTSLPENAKVIAWGESTAAELTENNIVVSEILAVASIGSLLTSLQK